VGQVIMRLILGGLLVVVGLVVLSVGATEVNPVRMGVGGLFMVLGLFVAVSGGHR
jgi:hypothetical protein